MAQLLATSITGSLAFISSTVNTGSGGNVWYSSALKKLQYSTCIGSAIGTWSTGGAMIVARSGLTGIGTQNEALAAGGGNQCTEEYNGTSWSTGGALIITRTFAGTAGTQNLGLIFGSSITSEEYNGTTWSTGGNLNLGRNALGGAGTQNAGLAFGGGYNTGYPYYQNAVSALTERYNGTSWSIGCSMLYPRANLEGAGTQNLAIATGGNCGYHQCTEEYNGTWSAGNALIYARPIKGASVGIQNQTLTFSGNDLNVCNVCSELYNGTSWTAGAGLILCRASLGGAGTANAGLAFGGVRCVGTYFGPYGPEPIYSNVSCTEEFTRAFATASV